VQHAVQLAERNGEKEDQVSIGGAQHVEAAKHAGHDEHQYQYGVAASVFRDADRRD
jgi:hypothetical protein